MGGCRHASLRPRLADGAMGLVRHHARPARRRDPLPPRRGLHRGGDPLCRCSMCTSRSWCQPRAQRLKIDPERQAATLALGDVTVVVDVDSAGQPLVDGKRLTGPVAIFAISAETPRDFEGPAGWAARIRMTLWRRVQRSCLTDDPTLQTLGASARVDLPAGDRHERRLR